MDTVWFAVDSDGHVAVFDSGEAGAVPTNAYDEDHWETLRAIRESAKRNGAILDFASFQATTATPHVELWDKRTIYPVLMFLESVDEIRDLLAGVDARELASTFGKALFVQKAERPLLEKVHERGACKGCFLHYEPGEDGEATMGELGLFEYHHTTDNWAAGPYALWRRPAEPLTLDDLPRRVAEAVIQFEGRFTETPVLQPVELWACDAWGDAWVATDLTTVRALPGKDPYNDATKSEVEKFAGHTLEFKEAWQAKPEAIRPFPASKESREGARSRSRSPKESGGVEQAEDDETSFASVLNDTEPERKAQPKKTARTAATKKKPWWRFW